MRTGQNKEKIMASPGEAYWPGQTARQTNPPEARMAWLYETVEAEIIPRLMAAHQSQPAHFAAAGENGPHAPVSQEDILAFTEISLHQEAQDCDAFIEGLQARGVTLEEIFLDLLAPSARLLGERWTADTCSFTDVTIGLWRMQQVLYNLSPSFQSTAEDPASGPRRIMIAVMPQAQHTFGALMAVEFFRQAGWQVWSEPGSDEQLLLATVRHQWFDMIGLSLSVAQQLSDLPRFIKALRKNSKNSAVGVMLGGSLFTDHPEYLRGTGADVLSTDIHDALAQADRFLNQPRMQQGTRP